MRRWRTAMVGVGSCLALAAGCAASRHARSNGVPDALKPPQDQELVVAAHGSGVQIYECAASESAPASFAWVSRGPEAQLRYLAGIDLGRHYAGPTWEAKDGSKVVGNVIASDSGPDPSAIPWLLLRATSASGKGVFGEIESIQRLHTVGGKAPSTGCTGTYSGTQVRVAYSADYYFYAAHR